MIKKTISIFVAVIMVMSIIPTAAFSIEAPRKPAPATEKSIVSWGFEEDPAVTGWTFNDADGDGHNWSWSAEYANSGNYSIMSASYISGVGGFTPDNWAISPVFTVPENGAVITFRVKNYNSNYPETFGVFVIPESGTPIALAENQTVSGDSWVDVSFDITDVGGQNASIAIRHYNCYDKYRFYIDDVVIDYLPDPNIVYEANVNGFPRRVTGGMIVGEVTEALRVAPGVEYSLENAYVVNTESGVVLDSEHVFEIGETYVVVAKLVPNEGKLFYADVMLTANNGRMEISNDATFSTEEYAFIAVSYECIEEPPLLTVKVRSDLPLRDSANVEFYFHLGFAPKDGNSDAGAGVEEAVAAWNAANPEQQLERITSYFEYYWHGYAIETPAYVYKFKLVFNSVSNPEPFVELDGIVPLGWNYELYATDRYDNNRFDPEQNFEATTYYDSYSTSCYWNLKRIEKQERIVNGESGSSDNELNIINGGTFNGSVSITFTNDLSVSMSEYEDYIVYDFSNTLAYSVAPEWVPSWMLEPDPSGYTYADNYLNSFESFYAINTEPVLPTAPPADNLNDAPEGTAPPVFVEKGIFTFKQTADDKIDIDIRGISGESDCVYALVKGTMGSTALEWRKVNLIPATNVHYEESLLNYNQGGSLPYAAEWNDAGDAINPVYNKTTGSMIGNGTDRQSTKNVLYGFDATYENQANIDSNGRSMHVRLGQNQFNLVKAKTHSWPTVSFSFKGTGFDIIGRTGLNTGVYVVNVKNSNDEIVRSQIVNTRYFGTSYEEGNGSDSGTVLYQVPIVHIDSAVHRVQTGVDEHGNPVYITKEVPLAYDSYTVEVQLVWMRGYAILPDGVASIKGSDVAELIPGIPVREYELIGFDTEAAKGNGIELPDFDVYVDAIRVYNPLGLGLEQLSDKANSAYGFASELFAPVSEYDNELDLSYYKSGYTEIRSLLNEASDLTAGGYVNGGVAIDITPHTDADGNFVMPHEGFSVLDYLNYGPNNEVYLKKGQGFAFSIAPDDLLNKLHISAKAPFGSVNMKVSMAKICRKDSVNERTYEMLYPVNTATEMYFDLTELIDYLYYYGEPDYEIYVVITAEGDGILSLCEIKSPMISNGNKDIASNANLIEFAAALLGGSCGDVNADGCANLIDSLLVMRSALCSQNLGVYGNYCADTDANGVIDMIDALSIMRMSLNY